MCYNVKRMCIKSSPQGEGSRMRDGVGKEMAKKTASKAVSDKVD